MPPARVTKGDILAWSNINGITVAHQPHGSNVTGLPERKEGVYYIVSFLVATHKRDRDDLLVPDDVLYDSNGEAVAARRFRSLTE